MMMKKYNLYIILFICTLSSCSDFLEESSQDLMIPRSVKDYKELFFGEVMKTNEKDIPHPYLEYMTDDVKDQCYYGTRPQPPRLPRAYFRRTRCPRCCTPPEAPWTGSSAVPSASSAGLPASLSFCCFPSFF